MSPLRIGVFILLVTSLSIISQAVKFSYILGGRQLQCFHQSAQKGTRYQIDIKGNSGQYTFRVNQNILIHSDSRGEQFYKSLSAFAKSNSGIHFCVQSFTNQVIQFQIEFYHGFYLQSTQQLKGANQFLDMTLKIQEISNMVEMNYNKCISQVFQRQPINNRVQLYATFTIIIFLVIVATVKIIYFNKVMKFMKVRKII